MAEDQAELDAAAAAGALSESGRTFRPKTMRTIAAMDEEKVNFECIAALVAHVVRNGLQGDDGAVLVFVPGLAEIMDCMKYMQQDRLLGKQGTLLMIPLHSALSSEDQHKCFVKAPRGTVKVVVSTNVAETSLTIDDITVVIDAGKMKEMRYDPRSAMSSLVTTWYVLRTTSFHIFTLFALLISFLLFRLSISFDVILTSPVTYFLLTLCLRYHRVTQANAKQRAGRAGRVRPGLCYHLFTKARYEREFPPQQLPEMLRAPLEALCLHVKILGHANVEQFLSKALEPPARSALRHTLLGLKSIRALEQDRGHETLTPLGYHLASLPVDVRLGKMMLYGAIFRCLDPVLTVAAGMSLRSPFYAPLDRRDAADDARRRFTHEASDHLTLLHAYEGWLRARARGDEGIYKTKYFLSVPTLQTMRDMKRQFAELLSSIKFAPPGVTARSVARAAARGGAGSDGVREATGATLNANSDNYSLVQAVIVAGLYPNLVRVEGLGALKQDPRLAKLLAPRANSNNLFNNSNAAASTNSGTLDAATATAAAAAAAKAVADEVNAALTAPVTSGAQKIFEPATAASVLRFMTQRDGELALHPTSAVFGQLNLPGSYFVFQQKMKTGKTYLRDLSPCSPYALLLFGNTVEVAHAAGLATVDRWADLRTRPRVAVLFKNLRALLHRLLRQKIEQPELDLAAVSEKAVAVTAALFEAETEEGAARLRAQRAEQERMRAADAKTREERAKAVAARMQAQAQAQAKTLDIVSGSSANVGPNADAGLTAAAAKGRGVDDAALSLLLSVPAAAGEIEFGGLEPDDAAPMFAAEDGVYGMYDEDLDAYDNTVTSPTAVTATSTATVNANRRGAGNKFNNSNNNNSSSNNKSNNNNSDNTGNNSNNNNRSSKGFATNNRGQQQEPAQGGGGPKKVYVTTPTTAAPTTDQYNFSAASEAESARNGNASGAGRGGSGRGGGSGGRGGRGAQQLQQQQAFEGKPSGSAPAPVVPAAFAASEVAPVAESNSIGGRKKPGVNGGPKKPAPAAMSFDDFLT